MTDTLSTAEAADRLGISASYLGALARARQVPHHRFGRLVRFNETDLAAILAQHHIDPTVTPTTAKRRRGRAPQGRRMGVVRPD